MGAAATPRAAISDSNRRQVESGPRWGAAGGAPVCDDDACAVRNSAPAAALTDDLIVFSVMIRSVSPPLVNQPIEKMVAFHIRRAKPVATLRAQCA